MNKFTGVLLLGTALLAGCVDREGYYNSVREEESHGLTLQPYTRCMPPRIIN